VHLTKATWIQRMWLNIKRENAVEDLNIKETFKLCLIFCVGSFEAFDKVVTKQRNLEFKKLFSDFSFFLCTVGSLSFHLSKSTENEKDKNETIFCLKLQIN
jgi:hypothetical protein